MKSKSGRPFLSICLLLLLLSFCKANYAQVKLKGSYVAVKVTYLSDEELPDENILKYTYAKYTFDGVNKVNHSSVYYDIGPPFLYEVNKNRLIIKTEAGFAINTMKILEHTPNKLVLVMASQGNDLESHQAIKYVLYNEKTLQNTMPFTPNDIFSIKEKDTVYRSGQKIYAEFKGPAFLNYVYNELEKTKSKPKTGELNSTFIVDASGLADSLKIIQGIDPGFDAKYVAAFNSAKRKWIPAQYNGKAVKVLMSQRLKFLTSEESLPSYFATQKANAAYLNKDYETALFFYDKAIAAKPDEAQSFYRRGICKQMLGNIEGACSDWKQIKAMGQDIADELLSKFCAN